MAKPAGPEPNPKKKGHFFGKHGRPGGGPGNIKRTPHGLSYKRFSLVIRHEMAAYLAEDLWRVCRISREMVTEGDPSLYLAIARLILPQGVEVESIEANAEQSISWDEVAKKFGLPNSDEFLDKFVAAIDAQEPPN